MLPLHGLNAEKQPLKGDFWGLSGATTQEEAHRPAKVEA